MWRTPLSLAQNRGWQLFIKKQVSATCIGTDYKAFSFSSRGVFHLLIAVVQACQVVSCLAL